MDLFSSAAGSLDESSGPALAPPNVNTKSPQVPGASPHSTISSAYSSTFHNDLLSFVSYIKSRHIPIFSVSVPDIRSVLGRGASFLVNGAEMPETYTDDMTCERFEKGSLIAFKRAVAPQGTNSVEEAFSRRINLLFNEVLTMKHPPLAAHPNIVQLLGIAFEVEGRDNAMAVLVPECAELGNLAEVLETAKREARPFGFEEKLAMCVDIAHGLEALHACDIIHGDVKCENVLVFEANETSESTEKRLTCKLIDFGYSHLDASSMGFPLGGSPPWQAPELTAGKYFRLENAKRTDIYSFGLLVWRLMLDGNPFQPLEESLDEGSEQERRTRRNEEIASLKHQDKLTDHVCATLASSGVLSEDQLSTVVRVIRKTLVKDPSQRELSIPNIIRLLDPKFWYKTRQVIEAQRISLSGFPPLLDVAASYKELGKADAVVKEKIAKSFYDYARGASSDKAQTTAAALQLAFCYAIGFGVPFEPKESVKWLEIASAGGLPIAFLALPRFKQLLENDSGADHIVPSRTFQYVDLALTHMAGPEIERLKVVKKSEIEFRDGEILVSGEVVEKRRLLLAAAEGCQYDVMELLLSQGVPGSASSDEGVTALHFLHSWDLARASDVGRKLIQAGGDIDAHTNKDSASLNETPLTTTIRRDCPEHSLMILKLGGSPTTADSSGMSALSLCAQLHLHRHLRLLLMHSKPAEVEVCLYRMLVAAASGESRFTQIFRHGSDWQSAPLGTFRTIRTWHFLFPGLPDFGSFLMSALQESLKSTWGPSNTYLQLSFLDAEAIAAENCTLLLKESILTDNRELFDALLARKTPVAGHFGEDRKTLLHLIAQKPHYPTSIRHFGLSLLNLNAIDINARDAAGQTPLMDAVLDRRFDLALILLRNGADPFATTSTGYTILGLLIRTLNLGSAKWCFKYSGAGDLFRQKGFIVHPGLNISAIQEAARLKLPRAQSMKREMSGLFLFILAQFMADRANIDFRSDGTLPNASALDIAAANGNVHAVKGLVKKGAYLASGRTALALARKELENTDLTFLDRTNLERCVFIIENWERDPHGTEREADSWTKLRTIDEDNVRSSWEVVAYEWKVPSKFSVRGIDTGEKKDSSGRGT